MYDIAELSCLEAGLFALSAGTLRRLGLLLADFFIAEGRGLGFCWTGGDC